MVEVFKTDVKSAEEADALMLKLQERFPCIRFNFDLLDCDKILRAEGTCLDVADIMKLLAAHHYNCVPLPD